MLAWYRHVGGGAARRLGIRERFLAPVDHEPLVVNSYLQHARPARGKLGRPVTDKRARVAGEAEDISCERASRKSWWLTGCMNDSFNPGLGDWSGSQFVHVRLSNGPATSEQLPNRRYGTLAWPNSSATQ